MMGINGIGGLIVFILDIWAIVSIFNSSATTGTKVIWIVVVVVFPIVGFIVWFFAGPRATR